jgi:uncharacterized protein (DUF4415 family)
MSAPRDRSHDEVVVDMLKADPEMADVYLETALEEADLPGGPFALGAALRHIAEAQGIANVAEKVEAAASKSEDDGHPTTEVTLWLDVEVVDKFKASGDGWQTRINEVLRVALERGALKAG